MAKLPFLSHLFKGSSQDGDPEPPEPAAAPELKPEPKPEPAPTPALSLPPEHAMSKLWALHREQGGMSPPPLLQLWEPGADAPPGVDSSEQPHLQMLVNLSANQRLAQAKPKKEGEPLPSLPAQAAVFVSGNQMAAWLLIYPSMGKGAPPDRKMLTRALRDAGVSHGVDDELLDILPEQPDSFFRLYAVAQGTAPVHGKDGYVVDLFPRKTQHKFVTDDYGQIDYNNLNLVHNIAQGDVICRMIPPTSGTPGRTVLGKELPARDGRSAAAPAGRNTRLSDDGGALLATQSGHVEFNGRSFQVNPVMDIPGNVDYSVGNINFVGDVHIHGDVLSGFSVRSMGSITVDGVVEACSIEAGRDLTVVKGIVGNEQAVIRAQRSIYTKYLENSCVYARDSLQADCIVNCEVYSDGVVQARTGRGTIIGGRVWAAQEVSASTVGTQSEVPTAICLGGLPCEEFERDVLVREIAEYEAQLDKLEKQPDSATKLSMLSKTRVKLSISRNRLEQVDSDLRDLQQQLEARRSGRLRCDVAYGGTEVTIDGVSQLLRREMRPCNASLVEGELIFT